VRFLPLFVKQNLLRPLLSFLQARRRLMKTNDLKHGENFVALCLEEVCPKIPPAKPIAF
jgi:hypothetical protein